MVLESRSIPPVRNTSTDAIVLDGSTKLITDLHFVHGRYGQVRSALDATGAVVRSPNWDIGVDERFKGKDIDCRWRYTSTRVHAY
jgi:hypothetical protein